MHKAQGSIPSTTEAESGGTLQEFQSLGGRGRDGHNFKVLLSISCTGINPRKPSKHVKGVPSESEGPGDLHFLKFIYCRGVGRHNRRKSSFTAMNKTRYLEIKLNKLLVTRPV